MNPSHPPMSYPACISTLHVLTSSPFPPPFFRTGTPLAPTEEGCRVHNRQTERGRGDSTIEVLFPKLCLHMPCSTRLTITLVHCMQLQRKLRERPLYSVFTVMGCVLCAVALPHNVIVSALRLALMSQTR